MKRYARTITGVAATRSSSAACMACPRPFQPPACTSGPTELNKMGSEQKHPLTQALLLAIQGSLRGKALPRGFIAFGEVGLAGEEDADALIQRLGAIDGVLSVEVVRDGR